MSRYFTLILFLIIIEITSLEEVPSFDDGVEITSEIIQETPIDLHRFKRNTENILKSYIDKLKNVSILKLFVNRINSSQNYLQ